MTMKKKFTKFKNTQLKTLIRAISKPKKIKASNNYFCFFKLFTNLYMFNY